MDALDGKVAVMAIAVSAWLRPKVSPRKGPYVFITGRRQAELDKAFSLIGNNVTAVQGDVSKPDDLDRLYEVARKVKGGVDIVFTNARVVKPAGGNRCKRRLSRTVRRNG